MPPKPPPPPLLSLLQQASQLQQAGRLAEAEQAYRQVLAAQPGEFMASHMLGIIRLTQGRNAEALELIGAALKADPASADALSNYGYTLRTLGREGEALAATDKALALNPRSVQALFNRAAGLAALGRHEDALAAYDKVLALSPGLTDALNNRANLLRDMGRLEEAMASHNKAVALNPRDPQALFNRGVTLYDMNRFPEALTSIDRALAIQPGFVPALASRAMALWQMGRFSEALDACDRTLMLAPDMPNLHYTRGNILWELKRPQDALAAFDRVLALDPANPFAAGGVANAILNLCDWPRIAQLTETMKRDIPAHRTLISPFTLLGYQSDPALQLECARATMRHRVPRMPAPLWTGAAHAHDRIRLAYLSYDFIEHPVAIQIAELIERHDRSRFEVIGVSVSPEDASPMRRRLMAGFDRFLDVRTLSDRAVAEKLRALEVDILVDLGGHTHGARLEILSHRPAPVQVSYLGYPGTTGADFVDYVLADEVLVPFDQQPFYSEKIVHLPVSYMVNDATRIVGPTPSRARMGLPEQGFVFCSFNKYYKVSATVFAVWMRLLHQVPGSVLWLKEDGDIAARDRLLQAARQAGVDPGRIYFAGRVAGDLHLARHRVADLFLDSLPYNAHVTACDALWAGLPMITCLGNSFAGRVAGSLLTGIGLPELVTNSLDEYEALALKLARDPALLQTLREKLARNRRTTPLFDTVTFARNIEMAYRRMIEAAARGERPQNFSVA